MGDPSSNMLQYAFDCFQHFFDKTVFYHKWSVRLHSLSPFFCYFTNKFIRG